MAPKVPRASHPPPDQIACEGLAKLGKPQPWEGQATNLLWAQGLRHPPASLSWRKEEATGAQQPSCKEAGLEFCGFQVYLVPQAPATSRASGEPQQPPEWADSSVEGWAWYHQAAKRGHHKPWQPSPFGLHCPKSVIHVSLPLF